MGDNPLSPQSVLQAMADALPTHPQGVPTSDMSSSAEAVALFTHACMINLDFRLLGFNEDQKMESECAQLAPRLPAKWNDSVSSYSFLYAHTQSSMQFITKIDRLGAKIEIRGLAVGADNINRLELTTRDYISASALPLRITLDQDTGAESRDDLASKLQAVFISPTRITDLASLLKINIIQRLIPSLQKAGYEETKTQAAEASQTTRTSQPSRNAQGYLQEDPDADDNTLGRARATPLLPEGARPYPFDDPLAAPPRRNPRPLGDFAPPDFDDELDIHRRHLFPSGVGGGGFGGIGYDDLNPPGLGPQDPLRHSFVPGPGYGGGIRGGMPGGGGMHPTFDDPLFQGPRGGRGGGQGQGYDPQAPPGARWDPVGPGGGPQPRFGGGRPGDDDFGGGFGPGGFGGGGGIL